MTLKKYPGLFGILILLFVFEFCRANEDSDSSSLNARITNDTTLSLAEMGAVRVKRGFGSTAVCIIAIPIYQSPAGGRILEVTAVIVKYQSTRGRKRRSLYQNVQSTLALSPKRRFPEYGAEISRSTLGDGRPSFGRPGQPESESGPGTRSGSGPGRILTSAQAYFDYINHNLDAAQEFQRYLQIRNPRLANRVIINSNGVTCQETCANKLARVGLVGICTSDFCLCDEDANSGSSGETEELTAPGHHDELRCVNDKVFDPVTLRCKDPRETEMCSDYPTTRDYDYGQYPDQNSDV